MESWDAFCSFDMYIRTMKTLKTNEKNINTPIKKISLSLKLKKIQ